MPISIIKIDQATTRMMRLIRFSSRRMSPLISQRLSQPGPKMIRVRKCYHSGGFSSPPPGSFHLFHPGDSLGLQELIVTGGTAEAAETAALPTTVGQARLIVNS